MILVACEESQAVTKEFRRLGFEAFSCDLIECSGGHPEWHIQQSVSPLLNGNCRFKTVDGKTHEVKGKWDMILAFPPCTYLTVSGNRWFDAAKYGAYAQKRWDNRCVAICFFLSIAYADCDRIAIENPIGVMSRLYRKPNQIIQPYQFGHHARKATCLWLKGLPKLTPTDIVDCGEIVGDGFSVGASLDMARDENGNILRWNDPRTALIRSKTYPGIANAMAEQWSPFLPGGDKHQGGDADEIQPETSPSHC